MGFFEKSAYSKGGRCVEVEAGISASLGLQSTDGSVDKLIVQFCWGCGPVCHRCYPDMSPLRLRRVSVLRWMYHVFFSGGGSPLVGWLVSPTSVGCHIVRRTCGMVKLWVQRFFIYSLSSKSAKFRVRYWGPNCGIEGDSV